MKAQQTSAQSAQELAAAYRFPQAQKEEGKDENKTADAVLHFCPVV